MDQQLNSAPCGYVSISKMGIIKEMNQTFLKMIDYRSEELLYKHIESILSIANKFIFNTYFYPFIQLNGNVEELYLTLKSSKGEDIPVLLNGVSSFRGGEEVIDCVFFHMKKRIDYEQEIRQAKKQLEKALQEKNEALERLEVLHADIEFKQKELLVLNEQLIKNANTDNLTGLYNRRYFFDELKKVPSPFSVLIIDVDHFKKVNDTLGHLEGDEVLKKIAALMQALCEEGDILARYGGEEFILLLPFADVTEAKRKAEAIRNQIQTHQWDKCPVTVSVGAATQEHDVPNMTILTEADRALYASKNNGRNLVTHSCDNKKAPV